MDAARRSAGAFEEVFSFQSSVVSENSKQESTLWESRQLGIKKIVQEKMN
jgi:hypothetical protein